MNILTTIAQNLQETIAQNQNRNARAKAVRSALVAVTARHPEYRDVGFDEVLMNSNASKLMEPFLTDGTLPTVDALAAAWVAQFKLSVAGSQKATANITPIVNDFIYILETSSNFTDAQADPAMAQEPSTTTNGYASTLQLEPAR